MPNTVKMVFRGTAHNITLVFGADYSINGSYQVGLPYDNLNAVDGVNASVNGIEADTYNISLQFEAVTGQQFYTEHLLWTLGM